MEKPGNMEEGYPLRPPNEESGLRMTEREQRPTSIVRNFISERIENPRMVLAAIVLVLLIAVVIGISCLICFAIDDDDDDEKFDRSKFNLQQIFNGSFQMLYNPFSNETQLLNDLQNKLSDLYRGSPALGRFFSEAETFALRNASAEYRLTFNFSEDQQTELRKFTLSWEMVYNVLRQFLYDQDPNESEAVYIVPGSLKMYTMN